MPVLTRLSSARRSAGADLSDRRPATALALRGSGTAAVRARPLNSPPRPGYCVSFAQALGWPRTVSRGTAARFARRPGGPSRQSQSLSRSYGSILPTSLTYIVLIDQRLFTLEACCGLRYVPGRKSHLLARIFKGRRERSGHRKSRGALREQRPYLRPNRFHGHERSGRRDNSPRGSRRRLRVRLRRRVGAPSGARSPPPGSGILTAFPFGRPRDSPIRHIYIRSRFGKDLSCPLGTTDPCSTAVHMEPFSTSVLKGLT